MLHSAWVTLNQVSKGLVPPPKPTPGERRHVLLVHAHPLGEASYSGALAAAVRRGLHDAGHTVTQLSLYDTSGHAFAAALTPDERTRYLGPTEQRPDLPAYPTPSRDTKDAVAQLQRCDALVFVYPTWWFNVPGVLKGWIDRTLLPGVAFKLPVVEKGIEGQLIPGLTNVKKLGVVTTFGAPRHIAFLAGDNGTNMLARAILPLFDPKCTITWHGLFSMDAQTPQNRKSFLDAVYKTYRDDF